MIELLQRRLNAVKLSSNPDAVDALLDTMLEVGSAFARVEHGARCYMRQNKNTPWKASEQ